MNIERRINIRGISKNWSLLIRKWLMELPLREGDLEDNKFL